MATLTTPGMNLPYPDGAERVMDGDNAIGALALAIDRPLQLQNTPPGAVCKGPARTMTTSVEKIPLDTLSAGLAGYFDDAGDQLKVPAVAGQDGMFLFWAWVQATLPTAAGFVRPEVRANGVTVLTGSSIYVNNAAIPGFCSIAGLTILGAGSTLSVWVNATTGNLPTVIVQAFGLVRLGAAFGSLLAERDEAEAQPA